jgi:hypothetical protein
VGRIECGGGEGGEPALSPPGWKSYASRVDRYLSGTHDGCAGGSAPIDVRRHIGTFSKQPPAFERPVLPTTIALLRSRQP